MLPVVLAATFLYGFDFNVVNVALPSLHTDLGAGRVALELVTGGYAFAYATALVIGGRLGDLVGHRRMFLLGMGAFTAASVLCGLAQSPGQLVGARLLQGLAAALMVPQVLALITHVFPVAERGGALAWFGVTGALSGVAGQVLGGLLLDADVAGLRWRAIFLVNLPVGLVVLACASRMVPATRSVSRPSLDFLGALGVSGGIALALVPVVVGVHGRPWLWAMPVTAAPALLLTAWYETRLARRGGAPLLDLALFRNRTFVVGLAIAVAFMAFFTSSLFTLSLLLQAGLGLSPLRAGLSTGPFALMAIVTALGGRPLVARYGAPAVIRAGCALSALGLVPLATTLTITGGRAGVGWLVLELALVGAGNSMILTAYLGAALSGVRPDQAGVASGTLNTIQQLAGIVGLAVIGDVFFSLLGARPGPARYAHATAGALWIGLGLVVLIAALTRLLTRSAREPVAAAPTAAAPGAAGRGTTATRAVEPREPLAAASRAGRPSPPA
jgi:MFS family permease